MPTDWESRYLEKQTPWDRGAAHPWLSTFRARSGCPVRVLVPGCGLGHDLRELSRIFPDGEIVGVDASPTALQQASALGVPANARFQLADVLALPGDQSFDVVWEHTLFCAIDPDQRDAYRDMIRRVLKPGGILFGAFFLTMPQDEAGPPFNCPPEEFAQRFAKENGFRIHRKLLMPVTYPGREGEEWAVIASVL